MPPDTQRFDERVLILAPTAKDGALCQAVFAETDLSSRLCADLQAVCAELEAGAGAAVISEEALSRGGLQALVEVLGRQPAWSDFPLLILTGQGADSELAVRTIETLGNVTLLELPVRIPALVSAVQAALRARRRQYQIRDHLAEMRRITEALRESDRRKDEFLAILAHELRNPLAPLRNALEALRRWPDNREAAIWAREIMARQVEQLVRLIDDLLDVSRVSSGKINLERERLELYDVVIDALETCLPSIEHAGHVIELDLPAEPIAVHGDRTRLVQVLCNLLSNAVKYTPSAGHIEIGARTEGDWAVVSIADSGIGIPPAMVDKVFDMFVQVENSLERSQGGLGIGLTLVKRLVELHGGTIRAHSAGPGHGSAFTFTLPLAASAAEGQTPAPHAADNTVSVTAPLRILVADDNRDAADTLANMLRLFGHEVSTAYDGEEAVSVAATFHPALAFLDIGMPRLNGYEAARAIRGQPHGGNMLLVALTGWGQPEDKRRSRSAGFDHHLVKPVDPAVLERLLAQPIAVG